MLVALLIVIVYAFGTSVFVVLQKWNLERLSGAVTRHNLCMKEIHERLDTLEKKHTEGLNLYAKLEHDLADIAKAGITVAIPVKTKRRKSV